MGRGVAFWVCKDTQNTVKKNLSVFLFQMHYCKIKIKIHWFLLNRLLIKESSSWLIDGLRSINFFTKHFNQCAIIFSRGEIVVGFCYTENKQNLSMRRFAQFGTICAIWKTWKKHEEVLLLVMLQVAACNFIKSNTPHGCVFNVQMVWYRAKHHSELKRA